MSELVKKYRYGNNIKNIDMGKTMFLRAPTALFMHKDVFFSSHFTNRRYLMG